MLSAPKPRMDVDDACCVLAEDCCCDVLLKPVVIVEDSVPPRLGDTDIAATASPTATITATTAPSRIFVLYSDMIESFHLFLVFCLREASIWFYALES